jgi:hypothetical protein
VPGQREAHNHRDRLHSAIGSNAPADKHAGKATANIAARDNKHEAARERRKQNRQKSLTALPTFSN